MSGIWTKFLPSFVIAKIRQRPNLFKIATNTGWLVLDKLISMVIGLLVGAWVARYLGPAQYGILSYALAFVAVFTSIAGLGLRDIVIRITVKEAGDKNEVLGTTFVLQSLASVGSLSLSIGIAYLSRPDDLLALWLIAILSGQLVFRAGSNTLDYWFQSQVQSKFSVWARDLALLMIALVRIGLILYRAPLVAFAWAALAQAALVALGMAVWYKMNVGRLGAWRVSLLRARQLLRDSWPLAVSDLAVIVCMKIDQLMLGNMASQAELGVYSAAVRLSELWYFIPVVIGSSFFPAIVRSRENHSEQAHRERMQLFFDVMAGAAYAIAIPTAVLAPLVVTVLYGADYAGAGLILRVHIWAFVFVSLEVARSRWLVAENMTRFSMAATILGAITNVVLNLGLIPRYGGVGAAWATLASQAVSGYVSSILVVRLWPVFAQLTTSLLAPIRLSKIFRSLRQMI